MKKTSLALTAFLSLPLALTRADVKLPAIISDHMVLKKTAKVPIWGKAEPGEEVTVTLNGKTAKATADTNGKWKAILDLSSSEAGPFELTVQGKNQLKITDVLVGEVWVASGQSNMEWVLKNTLDAEKEIAESANPMLRQFQVKKATSMTPLEDCEGVWTAAAPETSGAFTAVGYYFGKALQRELKVPVGIVNASWGGTPSEAWTSPASIDSVPDLQAAKEKQYDLIKTQPENQKKWVAAFGPWLEETGREDKPASNIAEFAAPDASTEGWQKMKIPGKVAGQDISGLGAVWVRTEIDQTEPVTGALGLDFGVIEGFDSVYWNGELITSLDYKNLPGSGFVRRGAKYTIPANKVKTGKNALAIRIYAPVKPAELLVAPKVAGKPVTGEWLAKQEFTLPPLTAEQLAAAPMPSANPPLPQNSASQLFNGMIDPIVPYAISGAIWYQGESNAGRSYQYRTAFPLMISGWRKVWDQGDFPFYFCQLANYQAKRDQQTESGWAELREAQSSTLKLPKTGQAVIIDIGDSGDIHPRNKKDVGNRLALIALANDYDKKIEFSGPVYESMKVEDGKVRLNFAHTEGGLVAKAVPATYTVESKTNKTAPLVRNSPNSELEGFAICGDDKKWVWADAKVDGNSVVVWSDKVTKPVAVRYGWADNPTVNLYNGAGLPASPFRTDDFTPITLNNKYQ